MNVTGTRPRDAVELIDTAPVPCDGCPLRQRCARTSMCCKAFRRYTNLEIWLPSWKGTELKPI